MKTKIVSFILCGDIFTVRKRSCGKVMFSQTCVKNSLGEEGRVCVSQQALDRRGGVSQHALSKGGGGVCSGVCLGGGVSAQVYSPPGHEADTPPPRRPLQWTVRILLECILVNRMWRTNNITSSILSKQKLKFFSVFADSINAMPVKGG